MLHDLIFTSSAVFLTLVPLLFVFSLHLCFAVASPPCFPAVFKLCCHSCLHQKVRCHPWDLITVVALIPAMCKSKKNKKIILLKLIPRSWSAFGSNCLLWGLLDPHCSIWPNTDPFPDPVSRPLLIHFGNSLYEVPQRGDTVTDVWLLCGLLFPVLPVYLCLLCSLGL